MATRGPLGLARLRAAEKPVSGSADLSAPPILDGDLHALDYWHKHAEALAAADMLSPQDADSFALLCKVYSRLVQWEARLDAEPKLVRAWLDCLRSARLSRPRRMARPKVSSSNRKQLP